MNRSLNAIKTVTAVILAACIAILGGGFGSIALAAPAQGNEGEFEILIDVPAGYFGSSVTVRFAFQGKQPEITQVKAKAGKKGQYVDVTQTMSLDVTEDCTVYVVATDKDGKNYERSRSVTCFDKEPPTLNAAVSEGVLTVKAQDAKSGVWKVVVNGYDYANLKDGELKIRLSQFDGGYANFTVQAVDFVGNASEAYKVAYPYHKGEDDDSSKDPATELPVSVLPTDLSSAMALVTEHVITDEYGNVISLGDLSSEDGAASLNKEFLTIQTKTGKTFYLIVDRRGGSEQALLLTEVSENDLLNVTSDNSQTLPRNSAATSSGLEIKEAALPNNFADDYAQTRIVTQEELEKQETELSEVRQEAKPQNPVMDFVKANSMYVAMGGVGLVAIILGYYFKVVRKKKDDDDAEDDKDDDLDDGKEEADD